MSPHGSNGSRVRKFRVRGAGFEVRGSSTRYDPRTLARRTPHARTLERSNLRTSARRVLWCLLLVSAFVVPTPVWAGDEAPGPTAATLAAWNAYIASTEARLEREAKTDLDPATMARVRVELARGQVTVEEVTTDEQARAGVPDGRIHHWRGRVLVPGVSLDQLLAVVRDPANHKQEDVLHAKLLSRSGDTDRVYFKLTRSALVTASYNTEHQVSYRTIGATRVVSRSESTKVAELDNPGTPAEREKAPGEDRGYLWKMNAYWRYDAVPEGVLVTLESVTLSRDVPWAIAPIASPIVNSVARESVARTLRSLKARF